MNKRRVRFTGATHHSEEEEDEDPLSTHPPFFREPRRSSRIQRHFLRPIEETTRDHDDDGDDDNNDLYVERCRRRSTRSLGSSSERRRRPGIVLRKSPRNHREVSYDERSLFTAEFSDEREDEKDHIYIHSSDSSRHRHHHHHHRRKDVIREEEGRGQEGNAGDPQTGLGNASTNGSHNAAYSLVDRIAGMDEYIKKLKEMIIFPLLYPEVFTRLGISPPRGVLFHGPPGTGKTLLARLLAESCSIPGSKRKVSFFMKNGSDCLSKWIGEAEKNLRNLFEKAREKQPSIIFFDEIDGLAPERTGKQDQGHISLVATLLALMDGLDDRGNVVVIGATNRIDSLDSALRRPGRFDREFYFGLPDRATRRDILRINTANWSPPPDIALLDRLAEETVGFSGADLKALCVEAALRSLRRFCPRAYDLHLPPPTLEQVNESISALVVSVDDFRASFADIVPTLQRRTNHKRQVAESTQRLFEATVALAKTKIEAICYKKDMTGGGWVEKSRTCFAQPVLVFHLASPWTLSTHHLRWVTQELAKNLSLVKNCSLLNTHDLRYKSIEDMTKILTDCLPPGNGILFITDLLGLFTNLDDSETCDGIIRSVFLGFVQHHFYYDSPYLLIIVGSGTTIDETSVPIPISMSMVHLEIGNEDINRYLRELATQSGLEFLMDDLLLFHQWAPSTLETIEAQAGNLSRQASTEWDIDQRRKLFETFVHSLRSAPPSQHPSLDDTL